ncbi:beta-lactamase domain protein [Beutenbergia cavernae DSM 12333]|uniref:Beta-lactamase domain protein n=1 Tax=Beutenbergia cavernae (strain ATCC BAA-8 / DSM 12333 / CCUG 43141 / JCM 11478 / NBRC 16432 / NCIMB 13614 / HKI 0122) TaxID=471853 RepID=C5C4X2_BEUC1|nr:MBL fold metallo-hydrolase [Beutenbergia cavernae]ACQ80100.1 beta-lactamase domain protein [Beutenbergia cavernae DSM 12333]
MSATDDVRQLAQVAPGVWVGQVEFWATNTTVVVSADGAALVVDPALTLAEIDALAAVVDARGWRVVAGFATHVHFDHVLWSQALGAAPRWASATTVRMAREHPERVLPDSTVERLGIPRSVLDGLVAMPDGVTDVPWAGPVARVLTHDAHAPGHAALLLVDQRVLLAGDMVSRREVPLLDTDAADPVGTYRAGLEVLAAPLERGDVDVVVPGHGDVLDQAAALAVVQQDRAYLETLSAGVVPDDPRLADEWVRGQHDAQVAALGLARA